MSNSVSNFDIFPILSIDKGVAMTAVDVLSDLLAVVLTLLFAVSILAWVAKPYPPRREAELVGEGTTDAQGTESDANMLASR